MVRSPQVLLPATLVLLWVGIFYMGLMVDFVVNEPERIISLVFNSIGSLLAYTAWAGERMLERHVNETSSHLR